MPTEWALPVEDEGRTWMKGWSGPFTRLQQDWVEATGAASIRCFEAIGAFTCEFDARVIVNGYPFDRVPDVHPDEVAKRRHAHTQAGEDAIDRGTDLWEEVIRPEVESLLTSMRRSRPRSDALPGLVAHAERCLEAAAHIMGDLHWRMAFGVPGDWSKDYPELTGRPVAEAALFLQGIDHTTSRLVRRLRRLARLQRDGEPAFDEAFADLLVRFGTRTGRGYGSSAGFRDSTWAMEPDQVRELIATYARADLDRLDEREAQAKAARQRAVRRLRRQFAGTDAWPRLERAHRAAIARVKAMENHNHLMEQETEGLLRHAIHRLGVALVAAGVCNDAHDVFHFHLDELGELARDPRDQRDLVAARVAEHEARQALEPPPYLGAPPAPAPDQRPRVGMNAPIPEHPDGALAGIAASPGVAAGRARVVADSVAMPEVEPGDILVARDAGPAWTPVFSLLGGLVLDQGWIIQHAAIVCREYGIPCVLGTGTATTAIADGDVITVDGDLGRVGVPEVVG